VMLHGAIWCSYYYNLL